MATSAYHLTSNGPRANTLVVDMSTIPSRKVNMDMIAKFVNEKLQIKYSDVRSLQHNTGKALVFVEVPTEEMAIKATELSEGSHFLTLEQIKYKVTVYMEDGATTIRVHDVSPQTGNAVIRKASEKYGDVLWLKEDYWAEPSVLKGIKNGIRAVRVKLHTAVPSYINIDGEVSLVTYKHQQQTCRHCNRPVHWGIKCMEAGYMELQVQGGSVSDRLIASGVNYAEAVRSQEMRGITQKTAGLESNKISSSELRSSKPAESEKSKEVGLVFTNLNDLVKKKNQGNISNVPQHDTPHTRRPKTRSSPHNSRSRSNVRSSRTRVEKNAKRLEVDISPASDLDLARTVLHNNAYKGLILDDESDSDLRVNVTE